MHGYASSSHCRWHAGDAEFVGEPDRERMRRDVAGGIGHREGRKLTGAAAARPGVREARLAVVGIAILEAPEQWQVDATDALDADAGGPARPLVVT